MAIHKPELTNMDDYIIVIANKKVVGVGKHKDLLQNNEITKY